MNWLLSIVTLLLTINQCLSLSFFLEPGTVKCFLDEAAKETHIVVYYDLLDKLEKGQEVTASIYETNNGTLIHQTTFHHRKGKFSFVPHVGGQLKFCYISGTKGYFYDSPKIRLGLRHAIGVQEVDIANLVKHKDLQDIQKAARQLYKEVKSFVGAQVLEREQEDHLFNHMDLVDARIFNMVFIQCIVILAAGVYQVLNLRQFFKAKQLA